MKEYGVAFHCHHVELVEVVTRFSKRVAYIKIGKPRREHPLRLRLFRMIPDNRLPVAVRRALIPARTAWAKLKLLDDDYDAKRKPLNDDYDAKRKPLNDDYWAKRKPLNDDYGAKRKLLDDDYWAKRKPLNDDYDAKRKLLDDDYDAKHKLLEEAIQTAMPKLEKLHAELCPDCPWDGKTIFARSN